MYTFTWIVYGYYVCIHTGIVTQTQMQCAIFQQNLVTVVALTMLTSLRYKQMILTYAISGDALQRKQIIYFPELVAHFITGSTFRQPLQEIKEEKKSSMVYRT